MQILFGLKVCLSLIITVEDGVNSILGSVGVRVFLAEEPRVVSEVEVHARVVDVVLVKFGALHDLVDCLVLLEDFLEIDLRDEVAVVDHLEAVQILDDALDVQAFRRVRLKALHDQVVHDWIDRYLGIVEFHVQNI